MSELDGRTAPRQRFNLRSLLSRCPPCLHHRRQLLPHSWAHRLTARGSLLGWHSLFWNGSTLLPRPACPLRCGNPGTCCRAHFATLRAARCFRLACLWGTTSACGLGTRSNESCNCLLDTASFLSQLCHYTFNVHRVLSLLRYLVRQFKSSILSLLPWSPLKDAGQSLSFPHFPQATEAPIVLVF